MQKQEWDGKRMNFDFWFPFLIRNIKNQWSKHGQFEDQKSNTAIPSKPNFVNGWY